MIKIASLQSSDRELIFRETANISNISEVIIEKDFWVSFILEHLFNFSIFKNHLFFKGGTSLSKCYGLIQRFSEDVDLIIDPSLIKYSDEILWSKRSNTAQDKFNHKINYETSTFLQDKFIPTLKKELNDRGFNDFTLKLDPVDFLSVLFIYKSANNNSNYIKPEVKLEMGTLAARIPIEKLQVKPYIQEYNKEMVGLEFNVNTISLARTFYEKLTILHDMAHKKDNFNIRYSRHYYDTYMIIISSYFKEIIKEIDLLKEVVIFKNKFYYSKRSNMEDILKANIKLVPSKEAIKVFSKDYLDMQEMFFSETPSFNLILEKLKQAEIKINHLILNSTKKTLK